MEYPLRTFLYFLVFFGLLLAGPLYVYFFGHLDLKTSWQHASRNSTKLAPHPDEYSDAIIQAYAARAYNWRGMFSTHCWIAVKPRNVAHYTVYQVVGWSLYAGGSAVSEQVDVPDRSWFGSNPMLLLDIRGKQAEQLIPKIRAAVSAYPYKNEYVTWPGPNSNTFVAFIGRKVPELRLVLPPNSVGQDFLPGLTFFARAPSGTGYQVSIFGVFGLTLAMYEGVRITLFGLTTGLNFKPLALIIPGVGYLPSPASPA